MKSKLPLFGLAALAIFCMTSISCSKDNPDDQGFSEDIPYSRLEITSPMWDYVSGGNRFTYQFLNEMLEFEEEMCKQPEANMTPRSFMASPLSLGFELAMLLESVDNEDVRSKVCRLLGFGSGSQEEIRSYCSAMLKGLPELSRTTTVSLANLLVGDSDCGEIDGNLRRTLISAYDAQVGDSFSFKKQSEQAAKFINSWAEDKTSGRIKGTIMDFQIKDLFFFMANSLYFKGKWSKPFKARNTGRERFTMEDGETDRIPMMKQTDEFGYSESTLYQAVRLFYGNGAFVMDVILPKEGYSVKDVVSYLAKSDASFSVSGPAEVDLWLPRFDYKGSFVVDDYLERLGVDIRHTTNFKIYEDRKVRIECLKQICSISVDESGTEAAAVTETGWVGSPNGTPLTPIKVTFHADHPFIYTISETSTGAVLFAGVFRGDSY